MSQRFKNSRDRVKRAVDHARAFAGEWSAILGLESPQAKLREDGVPGWWALFAALTPAAQERADRNLMALELGEFAYQLRAALDGLMWDFLTYAQGAEPPPDAANRLEFPILNGKDRDFSRCGLHKFQYPRKLVEWLESIQPDAAERPSGDPDRGLKATLEDIHDLARFDRHRRLRVIAAIPRKVAIRCITMPPSGEIVGDEWLPEDLFGGEKKLARLKIECPGALIPYHVSLQTKVAVDISVENIQMYYDQDVVVQLNRFVQAVTHVINRFEVEALSLPLLD